MRNEAASTCGSAGLVFAKNEVIIMDDIATLLFECTKTLAQKTTPLRLR